MKKILVLLLAAMMTLSLVACGGKDTETNNDSQVENNSQSESTENDADTTVESTVPAFDCDWIATITFNEDGTFKFEVADYQIVEEGTWAISGGVLTVTKPSGNTCSSTVADGVCKLDYVADASEQLVGQFYTSNYAFLDTDTAAASSVPVLKCDWIATITFNEDGTFKFEVADYQIVEEGTYTVDADGVITVTKPSGNTCVSYTGDDGKLHLDYVADASEQLVGQFYAE